ncbi:polysaccharide deacetylase family protein [Parasphingorhabdus sp. DH2-15]|uniref:polysaccharide deacetylase family protein n=1 Tax=Parasphingorhabdus sp. DH2-15 TaxID=3444112 RepID=UPI003F687306
MSFSALNLPPKRPEWFSFPDSFGQRFIVTVDTEEDFDWNKPISRTGYGLDSLERLDRFQQFCEGHGVIPIYLVDYPVITHEPAAERLREFVSKGVAAVGAQLHPWVSPPFSEETNNFNSFAGNLPKELERAKLLSLVEKIEHSIGQAPIIYRAGRYGAGPNTAQILHEAGILIDTSVRSKFDYSGSDGPNYKDHPVKPYWLDEGHNLLELPLTTMFWGLLRRQGDFIFPRLSNRPTLRAALARTNLLERIALTPEGITVDEAIRAIDMALDEHLQLLTFSFHSPSLQPGHTPYVRNRDDLDRLYDWWRRVFAYCGLRNIKPASLHDIKAAVFS